MESLIKPKDWKLKVLDYIILLVIIIFSLFVGTILSRSLGIPLGDSIKTFIDDIK